MTFSQYATRCEQRTAAPQGGGSGMTLIELLVVVAILGLLTVTVIPNISGVLDRRRIRDAAGNVSAFASRAQSRALNAKEPRGFIIQPLASGAAAIDLFFADTPEAYAGDSTSSVATLTLDPNNSAHADVSFSAIDAPTLADSTFCVDGDAIQFAGHGPYFRFTPPAVGSQLGSVRMWSEVNQTPFSMVLPPNGSYPFRIRRQPTRASSGILQITNGAAIDLAASSWGGVVISALGLTKPITILYDAAGRPTQILHSGGVREPVLSPIYLLVGLPDLCGNDYAPILQTASTASQDDRIGANWQYADAYWVAIDNKTGLARTAPSAAAAANAPGQFSPEERSLLSQQAIRGAVGISAVE